MSPLWVFGFLLVTATLAVGSDISEELEDNEYVQLSDSILLPYHFKKTSLHCPAPDVRYPHETHCALFYECRAVSRFSIKFAYPHLMKCNTGKLFDKEQEKCVEASQAKCANSGNDQDNQDHGGDHKDKVSAGFGCPFPFGKFADPLNCGRYYQCTCATPRPHQCPENTMYDERKEECLDENLVRCGNRPGGIEIDDEFEELKERKNLRCPCSFGTFVHPDDCSKYMICIHDVPTVYTCKKNQLFHAQHKRCLPAEEVKCDPRINPDNLKPPVKKTTTTTTTTTTPAPTTTTTTPEPTTTTPEPTTTTPEPTTTTPEPTTTEATTTPAPVTTPEGKVTKPNTPPPHDCDEDDLDCIIDVTGDPKGWFDCPDRFGHFPHAGSEKLFIHCDNWRPHVKKCNIQEKFSPKMLVCVWIGNPGDHLEKEK